MYEDTFCPAPANDNCTCSNQLKELILTMLAISSNLRIPKVVESKKNIKL